MIRRRTALSAAASATAAATLAGLAPAAWAQPKKDSLVLAMTLEPPGLDPTAPAAGSSPPSSPPPWPRSWWRP